MTIPYLFWDIGLAFMAAVCLTAAAPLTTESAIHTTYDMPVDWTQAGFTTSISMGSPAQDLRAFVDWTWIGHFVLTTTCYGDSTGDGDKCLNRCQERFYQSDSHSFQPLPSERSLHWNPNHFFFTNPIDADIAREVVRVGPVEVKATVQASNAQFDARQIRFPFSAVLGFCPVFSDDIKNASIQSPFYQAYEAGAWNNTQTGFLYCYGTNTSPCNGHDGIQTLGGYRQDLVHGEIEWHDVIKFPLVNDIDFIYKPPIYNYWTLELSGFAIGDEELAVNKSAGAVFDHASYGRGAPVSQEGYKKLIETVNATKTCLKPSDQPNNAQQDFYKFPNKALDGLKPLKYRFGASNREWKIHPYDYVVPHPVEEEYSILNVRAFGWDDFVIGNFGETFLIDKYIILDFGNPGSPSIRVGLADANYDPYPWPVDRKGYGSGTGQQRLGSFGAADAYNPRGHSQMPLGAQG
ncbi:aspartic peptidase domain-containing protein [Aspergillus minisclerotigenes]|uniref:Aspartic peptidase domain-containing protein n=1 Tax=Aspergillus minisclerotigenes TaxID=656917 RepID=A0A5N6J4B1_9EURO|nr:aspartic peptidase domain-containing protein [Aspergillus minisclerotigenes]